MLEVTLKVDLVLEGPILSHATSPGAVGIDSPMARDSADKYYIPRSLVRGHLRQAWQELKEATDGGYNPPISQLLGIGSGDAYEYGHVSGFEPKRGILSFTDFRYYATDENHPDSDLIYRIHMDSERGATRKGALQVMECPFPPGKRITFSGTISYIAPTGGEAATIESHVTSGLRWITNLGGERSVGFGRLVDVKVEKESKPIQVQDITATGATVLDIAIRPKAPFCVSKRRVTLNLFESDVVLSGAVLRGALANTLKRLANLPADAVVDGQISPPWKELGKNFNLIRFTHAFPALSEIYRRPVVPPFSLVQETSGQRDIYDVALCEGPVLLGGDSDSSAPSFEVDWKESDGTYERVRKEFGWNDQPQRTLRVRTAMERDSRRAREHNLFAYEMVVPEGYHWLASIDLGQVIEEERGAVESQLRAILDYGLYSIGKTKVAAGVDVVSDDTYSHPPTLAPIGNLWVITLQTPALLCDPRKLDEASGEDELFEVYASTWGDVSNRTLTLVRFFASQSLAGGYLTRRFQARAPYNPFLLTDAGSVFVLEASSESSVAQSCVESWNGRLPLPPWAKELYGEDWRTCPFLPDDGFGEMVVNLPCHEQKCPPQRR